MKSFLAIAVLLAACGGKAGGRAGYRELPSASPCAPSLDPVEVAIRAFSEDCTATAAPPEVEVEVQARGEGRVVVLTRRDLEDDSVRDERVRYELARVPGGEAWQIVWAGAQQRCWPGRGHQDFAASPCI